MNESSAGSAGDSGTDAPALHPKSSPDFVLPQQVFIPPPPVLDALYLHIPFCFHKCHYCDFYSLAEDASSPDSRQAAFVTALLAEAKTRLPACTARPRTLFVGGGTPTYLRPDLWRHLGQSLFTHDLLQNVTEFTVEANPETVTPEIADILRALGVNRLSMGAQSFDSRLLQTLERWHEPANVARAVTIARQAGITNINLDLIFAVPGQTLATLAADLDAALALEPDHLSCYGLTYEPQTAMTQRLRLGQVQAVPEDVERAMYEYVMQRLAQAGFEHYEVSNFARPGRQCQHNLIYWNNGNWLGLGPSAASHLNGWRWKNQPHLGRYLAHPGNPPVLDVEHLPPAQRLGEQLMLGLRLRQGVARAWLHERLPADDPRHPVLAELIQIGMLETTATHLRLTPRGLMVADAVIAKLL